MGTFTRALLLVVGLLAANLAWAANGELIVFTGDAGHAVTKDFVDKYLPQVKALAKTMDLGLVEKQVSKGAPEGVTYTPSIYFQNHLGRSLFIGRYQNLDKLRNFIRTVSRMPQASATNEKHDVLVWYSDRATVYSPVKLTALSGDLPQDHDEAAWHKAALKAFAKGAAKFEFKDLFQAKRTDRAVYLALYPYLGTDGKLWLSAEMYSQFNCVDPIFKRFDKPFNGVWKSWEAVFEEAGKELQAEIFTQLNSTTRGDGLIPVPSSTPTKSWEDLGLKLPEAPKGSANAAAGNVPLGTKWEFGGPAEPGAPVLSFSFMAPVDHYAGEVKTFFGDLEFGAGPSVEGAAGRFGIEGKSLTMGDPSLDAHVHEMIEVLEHPKAWFTFEKVVSLENPKLAYGSLSQFTVRGLLEFMEGKVPVDVTAQIEPVLDENGAPALVVNAAFSLRLKDNFGLDGPDGPQPNADTMNFLLNFLLKPKA